MGWVMEVMQSAWMYDGVHLARRQAHTLSLRAGRMYRGARQMDLIDLQWHGEGAPACCRVFGC